VIKKRKKYRKGVALGQIVIVGHPLRHEDRPKS